MRVLVAGCGYVGGALAAELAATGHDVTGLKRNPRSLPPHVKPYAGDLTRPASLTNLPDGLDAIVYAVGADARTEESYERAYVEGLSNLLDSLEQRGALPPRLLFTSSTAVYGQDDGEWVDETSPTAPQSFTGQTLLRAEAIVETGTTQSCSLRLAGIYGPGRTWLVRRVRDGEVRTSGGQPRYGNRIHRDDCAGVLAHLLSLEPLPSRVVGVDDAPAPMNDVYRFLAQQLGVPVPAEGPPDRARGTNKRASNRLLRSLGYTMRVPTYEDGYPAIVREILEAGN